MLGAMNPISPCQPGSWSTWLANNRIVKTGYLANLQESEMASVFACWLEWDETTNMGWPPQTATHVVVFLPCPITWNYFKCVVRRPVTWSQRDCNVIDVTPHFSINACSWGWREELSGDLLFCWSHSILVHPRALPSCLWLSICKLATLLHHMTRIKQLKKNHWIHSWHLLKLKGHLLASNKDRLLVHVWVRITDVDP